LLGEKNVVVPSPYLSDRLSVELATQLMTSLGNGAGKEAAARAGKSRDLGNIVHFCRWRQIERLIAILSDDKAVGSLH
jgi:hypothetical protein